MKLLTISTKNTMLYICILMLCLLILARDIMGIGVPGMAFAVMVATAAFILKLDKFKIFLFFLFPFTCGVPGYTMLVSIIFLVAKSLGTVSIRSLQIFPIVFVALLELFNCSIHVGDVDLSAYASFISFTAVFFFILFDKSNYDQSRECVIAFIFGTIFVAAVIYYKMITDSGLDAILNGDLRNVMDTLNEEGVDNLGTNANNIAYLSIILISTLLMGAKKLRLSPILYTSLFILSVLIGMGSFSRTWMFLFVLIIVVYLIHQRNHKALFSLVLIFGAFIILFPNILDGFTNVMKDRLTHDNIATGGGRTLIFSEFNELWSKRILYIIFGTSVTLYYDVLHCSHAMHNSIQQIYVCTGIMGLFLYSYCSLSFFKVKYKGDKTLMNYLPFFAGIIFLMSIQFLRPYFLMLPIIPAFYAYLVREEK